MQLTSEQVAATYDCLRLQPPFNRLKLPEVTGITFKITHHKDRQGHYTHTVGGDDHEIAVSAYWVGHFNTLLQVVAHEMLHLWQRTRRTTPKGDVQHNAEFRRLAKRVCKAFGWDVKPFITT